MLVIFISESYPKILKFPCAVAGKVKNLSLNRQGDNVTLTWGPPDDDSCLLGYRVKRNKESSLYTKETSFTFSASMPNSCYSNNIQVATLSESNHLGDAVELTYKEDDVSSDGKIICILYILCDALPFNSKHIRIF